MQTKVKLSANNHAPRTAYNQAVWAHVQQCKGIANGVAFSTLVQHLQAMPCGSLPSAHLATAHAKYLMRGAKPALVACK